MSMPADKLRPAEEEWIPELREEFNPAELEVGASGAVTDTDVTVPAPAAPVAPATPPAPARVPPQPTAPVGLQAGVQPGLERHRLEAIAARIEQQLQRKLNAAMTIVRIKLMQELRTQLLDLYKDYGQQQNGK